MMGIIVKPHIGCCTHSKAPEWFILPVLLIVPAPTAGLSVVRHFIVLIACRYCRYSIRASDNTSPVGEVGLHTIFMG